MRDDWTTEAIGHARERQERPPGEPGQGTQADADRAIARLVARSVADRMTETHRPPPPP